MANISDANGKINFINFTNEEITDFIEQYSTIFNEILVDAKGEGVFYGNGRWTFERTLEEVEWDIPKNTKIELHFFDEEYGCDVFYEEWGVINSNQYLVLDVAHYSLEETLTVPGFNTPLLIEEWVEGLGWKIDLKQFNHGPVSEVVLKDSLNNEVVIAIDTLVDYNRLREELSKY